MSWTSSDQAPFNTYTPNVAIVTGAAQGMGYSIAHRLADDGFDVAVNDVPAKIDQINAVVEELREKGRRATAAPGDVSSEADVISMVHKTVEELGGVDIMVANAGIPQILKTILETPVENFDKIYAVNARGVFLCFKYAAQQMVKQGRGGRLIAASSVAGKQGGIATVPYTASKFAIRAIAQCTSAELRRYGITANTYAPGVIMTPMLQCAPPGTVDPKVIGQPECVASVVSYLAKPESYFINGQSITVDGGHFRFD